jgi:glycopeptide antibiotics resistance protein
MSQPSDPQNNQSGDGDQEPPLAPPPGTGRWVALALAVYAAIVIVQLVPFDFDAPRGPYVGLTYPGHALLLLQVAIFLPLGLVDGELARRLLRGWGVGGSAALLVAVDAAILALICETAQYWIASRSSSLADILAAALGGVAGYLLFTFWRGHPE